MKNFRKVLALVLVVATLFSFAAMASAKYEDADKISYEMAVDVLSAVGILNGYEVAEDEFEFKPTNNISREEMAKMIAVLANSGADVSKLYASANAFADVENDRWSASYIAYCAQTGIVAGRTADTFDPAGKVTGMETAKMLLVLLGFDAAEQGYVGANWKINVLRDAKVMGLLEGFAADYNPENVITREEAANMMLNALCAPAVVGILNDGIIDVTNALIVDWKGTTNVEKLLSITGYAMLKDAITAGKWCLYDNVVISNDILYKTLFPGLKIGAGAECFGRSAVGFTYSVKGIVKASGNYATGTGKAYTTQVDLAADYKSELANGYYVTVTRNGVSEGVKDAAYVKTITGNGVDTVVNVKIDASNKYYLDVNVIETFIGKVANYNKYTGKFYITGTGTTITGVVAADAVKNDDYVLFQLCNCAKHTAVYGAAGSDALYGTYCVHDYEVVTPVVATVDYSRSYLASKHLNSCYMKSTEGETYKYNANYGDIALGRDVPLTSANEAKAYDTKALYLDQYGYIILMAEPTATTYVAYLEEGSEDPVVYDHSYVGGNIVTDWDIMIDAAVVSGTAGAMELSEVKTEDKPKSALLNHFDACATQCETGALVQYKVDPDGYAEVVMGAQFVKAGTKIAKTATTINGNYANENYTLNSDTTFIIRSFNAATNEWTYEEVIGVQNLAYTYYVEATVAGTNGTTAQVLDTDADKFAEYVFIDAQYVYGATEFIVLSDAHVYDASWTGVYFITDEYQGYRALVNGVEAIVCVNKGVTLMPGYLYNAALSFKDVVLDEDNGVALYYAAYPAYESVNAALQAVADSITITVGSAGDVDVSYTGLVDGKHYSWNAISEVPVYHLTDKAKLNAWTGYWVETNEVTDLGAVVRSFVVLNTSDEVTAIYIVHDGVEY